MMQKNANDNLVFRACSELILANMNDVAKKANLSILRSFQIYRAIQKLKKLAIVYPDNWATKWMIGKGYQLLGKDQKSYNFFSEATKANPDNAEVYREACIQANKFGLGEESERYAEKAIQLRPDDPGLYANKALSCLLQGKLQEAEEEIVMSLKMKPEDRISQNVHRLIIDVKEGRKDCPQTIP
jgi:tetratricopeptide (TPR) repeat protein